MKCERCGKEIPEVVMVEKSAGGHMTERLSNLAVRYRLFCSDECQRRKQAEERKKENPYG